MGAAQTCKLCQLDPINERVLRSNSPALAVRQAKKAGVLFFACAKVSWSSESVNSLKPPRTAKSRSTSITVDRRLIMHLTAKMA